MAGYVIADIDIIDPALKSTVFRTGRASKSTAASLLCVAELPKRSKEIGCLSVHFGNDKPGQLLF
ncbi:MAG: hypothetical protein V3T60_14465 [Candidatus Binatia bacterium]